MDWSSFRLSTRLVLSAELAEKLYATIAQIDAVKNTFHLANRLLPQTVERLTTSVIVTSTGASNCIEGNQLSDDEVEALYRSMRIKKFATRDKQEVAGYLQTLELLFESYAEMPITESLILQRHRQMMHFSEKDQSGNIVGVLFDPTPAHLTAK